EKMLLLTVNSFIISTVYRKGSISPKRYRVVYLLSFVFSDGFSFTAKLATNMSPAIINAAFKDTS
ncbi:hypothetical protein ABND91_22255, partial [Paenibacillus larvae]